MQNWEVKPDIYTGLALPDYTCNPKSFISRQRQLIGGTGGSPCQTVKPTLNQIPIHRLGRPGEITSLAAFLAGEDSSYTTSKTISVSGGY
jgi:NAD(P)-dependent dehydrogenase (short-subunit alcohol dehydrogenase family)